MYEMLRSLEAVGTRPLEELWNYHGRFDRLVNMARIAYARTVVTTNVLPEIIPGDLGHTGQVKTSAEFIAEKLLPVALGRNTHAYEHIHTMIIECNYYGINDKSQLCYLLATAYHESNMGRSMVESWNPARVPEQNNYEGGRPYRGRGYVHLTHRSNYARYTNVLNQERGITVDLVRNPDRAAEPRLAAVIIAHGMKYGAFRENHSLGRYGTDCSYNYIAARAIVNALTDRERQVAIAVANRARAFRRTLR